jgi:hypothetical protein
MTDVFVIRNQLGHYWGKGKAWVDGSEARAVMRARHRDEAVNTLFELSSRDVDLRGQVIAVELDARGEPIVEPSQVPLPIAAEADSEDDAGQAARPDEGPAPTQAAAAR